MMNYFSSKKKWLAYLVLLTFVFTCIVPTNIVGGNSAWAATEAEKSEQQTKQIAASGGVTENATDGVSISKTIAPTGIENYFDITLQVQAEETIKTLMQTQTTDVVIVLDISNTMNENNRLVNAKNAAKQFADYFYQALGTSGRLGIVTFNRDASVVHNFTDTQSYSAIATKIGSRSNEGIIAPSTEKIKWTNIEAGLKAASDLLNNSSAKHKYIVLLTDGFPTTYIKSGYEGYYPVTYPHSWFTGPKPTLNSDGSYTIPDGAFFNVRIPAYVEQADYSDKGAARAQTMANAIKSAGINIFSIGIDINNRSISVYEGTHSGYATIDCYTTSGDYVIGDGNSPAAYKNWLGNVIAGGPDLGAGKTRYSDGNDLNALKTAYSGILTQIEEVNRHAVEDSWIAADPMGDNVEFLHFYDKSGNSATSLTNAGYTTAETSDDENEASYTDAINWNLMKSKYSSEKNGDKTIYTYELKYRVRLENEANDFSESTIYNANGTTTLKYKVNNNGILSAEKSLTFKMPKVKGHLGEFSFTKVDSLTQKPLEGAKFTLTHNVAECAVCKAAGNPVSIAPVTVISKSDGLVSFANIPSGHSYVLTEAKVEGYQENKTAYPITIAYGDTDDSSLPNGTSGKVIANTPEKTEATVKKVWEDNGNQDGKRPTELKVTLSNGTEVTLNEGNSWTATIEKLPKYANGKEVTYTWTESAMPEGYTLTDTSVNGTITTLTNSYNVETIDLEIIKAWIGDENIADRRSDVQFTITGTVETDNGTETVSSQTATATAQDGWSVKVENLPRYNDGKFITYTVSEDVPAGYTVSWDKNVLEAETLKNGETVTVKATNTLQRAGILFVKDYVGGVFDTTVPDDTQAAQFKLKAEANAGGEEITLNRMGNTYSTTAGALQFGVMYTLSETVPGNTYVAMADRYLKLEADANGNLQVAEYDKDGKPVVNNNQNVIYPVQTEGYVKGYAQLEKIFNYPENATLKIFGQKSWVGGTTGSSIIVELFRNGITTGKTTEASVDFDWKYAFDGEFDRYDENGKPYIYTVVEHLIDGFTPYYGNTTDDNGNLVIDIVNVKNELSIDPYGDIWVEKQTNNDDYTSEYGFELWIQALKDESSNLNQEQQRDKTLLATALHSAKKSVEEAAANIEPKTSMFEASAFATSGSQYRFFVTEADNCTTKLGVTTGSALEITGVNMRIAEDANYEGDWFVNAIASIKTLVAEMAEAFVSGGQARPNTDEMLTKIRDKVTVTSGSALAYSEEGLTGMFDALAAYKQAQKDLTAAESAFAAFEASLSTPSSLILTVKGESPITLNPAEGTVVDGGKVFTVSGNSKVQTVYYYEDGKYYVVPFKLVKNERIDFHMEATTGSAIQYKVTEVDPQSANSTDLTIHFSADNKLTMANTLTSGIMDLTSGSAIGFEFYNKYVIGGNTGSDPVTKEETPETPTKEEKDPEESIPDENVPTGSVEPDEPLDELEDPEIPLGDAPATGDANNAVPFMALMMFALCGLVITRRKFN